MCDPVSMIAAAASAASTAIGIAQQQQRAGSQRDAYAWQAAQLRHAAAADEQRARAEEGEGEAAAEDARRRAALRLGRTQARLAAQGTDLLGSPVDVLGDIRAGGEQDALSLRYRGMRDAWEHRVRAAARQAESRRYDVEGAAVDPTLGIVRSLLS